MAPSTASTSLTEFDRGLVARARELAAIPPGATSAADAFEHLGRAKHLLAELADLAERLAGR